MSRCGHLLSVCVALAMAALSFSGCGGSDDDFIIPRIEATGVLDTSFDADGIVTHDSAAGGNGDDQAKAITTAAGGKIIVAGFSPNALGDRDMAIWKFNADGTPDTSFDGDGIVVDNSAAGGGGNDIATAVAISADGKILVTGSSVNATGDTDMVIWRYNADGTPDSTFDGDGIVVHNGAAGGFNTDTGYGIAASADGKIIVGGESWNATGNRDMVLWRYDSDGTLDATFGTNGIVVHNGAAGGSSHDEVYSLALDADGRILLAGKSINTFSDYDTVVWRFNTDGTPDGTFGTNGVAVSGGSGGGTQDAGYGIAIDADGKILVTGYVTNASANNDMAIWRFNTDGTPDDTFDTDGITSCDGAAGGTIDVGYAITPAAKGKILVTGYATDAGGNSAMVIWRYNADGTLDADFDDDGIILSIDAAGGFGGHIGSDIIVVKGKILVAGNGRNALGDLDMVVWRYK